MTMASAITRTGPSRKDPCILTQTGLYRAGLHEIYAAREVDGAAAVGFTLAIAGGRLAETGMQRGSISILWARHDMLQIENGTIYPPGLLEFGILPSRFALVQAHDVPGVLQAALDAARCASLAAIIAELRGDARAYDLTASQRLAFAAKSSGLALFLLRHAATPLASAAETRWSVKALLSRPFAQAPGRPAFEITLLRRRSGISGQVWSLEWNRDTRSFEETGELIARDAALSGYMAALPVHREAALRKAG